MMKKFTFNDIKGFCKDHFMEYMGESATAITFSFYDQDSVSKIGFIDMVEDAYPSLSGMWVYDNYEMFGEARYMFNFKRIA